MDELELRSATHPFVHDCCAMIVTESWLHPAIPDAVLQLAGRTFYRLDRNKDSGKSKGGGLCIYVNNDWCSQSRIIDRYCSPDLEALTVSCRPYYLPRELTVVNLTAVYIPPDANVSLALSHLHDKISRQQQAHPDGVHIIAADFNQARLKSVLPNFTQYVKCATREKSILDHVYCNIKQAYRALPQPHIGQSDHLSLHLIPAYTPRRRQIKPIRRLISTWPENALSQLQDCFVSTEWGVFENQDLEEYTCAVLGYISFCTENVTVKKTV